MPKLEGGMSKEEIIEILEKNELKYKFDVKKTSDNMQKGLYLYSPPGTGTWVPKGAEVKISIYE